jgi:hypothetical protein
MQYEKRVYIEGVRAEDDDWQSHHDHYLRKKQEGRLEPVDEFHVRRALWNEVIGLVEPLPDMEMREESRGE